MRTGGLRKGEGLGKSPKKPETTGFDEVESPNGGLWEV
jgi:hypothetical protein